MRILAILCFIILVFGAGVAFSPKKYAPTPAPLEYPAQWPKPSYNFKNNPLTREGIALGRRLFYDPILSRDSTVSCASCHLSFTAFTHVDHALSHGIQDRIGTRNSPALMNLAWANAFMWDGAVQHLDFQALAPISHPAEMDHTLEAVVQELSEHPRYPALFEAAFGERRVTGERVLKAIAQFELTLVSANAKYDRVQMGQDSFNQQEQQGFQLFQQHCARCHTAPLFTHAGFERNGLPLDTALRDFGRMRITGAQEDSAKFKVPTLRNVEFSQPYMHDGRFKRLRDVVNFYSTSTAFSPRLNFTPNEKTDLVAFLLTLTDRSFLFDPRYGFPKNE